MDKSTCAICVDFLTCEDSVAIPCGHTFHDKCIREWKKQSSTCPQCRVKFKTPIKLFFELSRDDQAADDPAGLRNQITELNLKIRMRDTSIDTLTKEKKKKEEDVKGLKDKEVNSQRLLEDALGTNDALKKQITYMEKFKNDAKRSRSELVALQKTTESYHNIVKLMKSESRDIENTIKNFADNPDSFNQITTSYVFFKKEFDRLKESKRILEQENKTYRKKADSYSQQLRTVSSDLKQLDQQNKMLTNRVSELEQSQHSRLTQANSMKRVCTSPRPKEGKRKYLEDDENVPDEECLVFEDDDTTVESNDTGIGCTQDLDLDEEESIKIADEFGLEYVPTTSLGVDKRGPLRDISTKSNKNSFASKLALKHSGSSKVRMGQSETSDLPHFKRGFNGMGGQTKTLVIPKRPSAVPKKIPKNNGKITKFCTQGRPVDWAAL